MDGDDFDELFADTNESHEPVQQAEEAPQLDPLERSQRAKKIIAQLKEDEDDDEEEEESHSEVDDEARPKNRPKLIPPGTQADDKILEARRDFEEALAKIKPTRRRRDGADSEEVVRATFFVLECV